MRLELLINSIHLPSSRVQIWYCANLYLLLFLVDTNVSCIDNLFILNLINNEVVISEELVWKNIKVVVGNLNVPVPWMIALKIEEPGLNDMLADLGIRAKLSTYLRILILVKGSDNNNVKVLREEWKTVVDLRSVCEEVHNVALVLVLDSMDLSHLNKAIDASDKHLLDLS